MFLEYEDLDKTSCLLVEKLTADWSIRYAEHMQRRKRRL